MEISEKSSIQEDWDKIYAVDRMQAYIVSNLNEEIMMQALCNAAGYSLWHSLRIFKDLLNMTPFEFIRAVKLTKAAEMLRDTEKSVLDVAMETGFDSHDGFTRAFKRQFNITPKKYQETTPALAYFGFTPIKHYFLHVKKHIIEKGSDEEMEKDNVSKIVTVTVVERPARKLILIRSKTADDYWSYCAEMGCDTFDLLNSIPERFETAALLTFPPELTKEGTAKIAVGVEVPSNYAKPLPESCDIIDLPPTKMLYFQGAHHEDGEYFGEALDVIRNAIDNYDLKTYGYKFAPSVAPRFNFGTGTFDSGSAINSAKMAVPIANV